MTKSSVDQLVEAGTEYHAGFVTDVESETLPPGLDESVVKYISARKGEPEWLTQWRLQAYAQWQQMREPKWAHVHYPPIDFQSISYYSAPKSQADGPRSLEEVDPELLRTYEKLGIPLHEQAALAGVVPDPAAVGTPAGANVAVDVVFDSVSIATTFKETLAEAGVIFCPISEAVHSHPALVQNPASTLCRAAASSARTVPPHFAGHLSPPVSDFSHTADELDQCRRQDRFIRVVSVSNGPPHPRRRASRYPPCPIAT